MNNQNDLVGFYRNEDGVRMSIQTAATMGFISRGVVTGTVSIKGTVYKSTLAVEAGFIDQVAADYLAKLPGASEPAPHTREDAPPHIEEDTKTPAVTVIDALGAFFIRPSLLSKQVAQNALESHLKASEGAF